MKHRHEIAAIVTIALMLPCRPVVLILGTYCFIQYLRSKNDKRNEQESIAEAARIALNNVAHGLDTVNKILQDSRFKKANKFTELATRAQLETYQDQLNISKIALSLILRDVSDDKKHKANRKLSTVG